MLAECSHLSTGERMRAGRSVLNPANMQGCGSEVDLFPAQIADLRCSQSMPKRKQHHEAIAGALPIPALAIDQLLDLTSGEMLPGAQLSIGLSQRDCAINSAWRDQRNVRIVH